jgi:hypothetical protein
MATDHILALLERERDKFTKAIEALMGSTARKGRPPGSGRKAVRPSVEPKSETGAPSAPAKRKLSAAGRRAIIAGTKKRWAAIRAAKAAAAAAKQERSPAMSVAARKKSSERMKTAWAARKKKAAAKGKGV